MIEQSCDQQGIARGQLTLHADHGPAMRGKNEKNECSSPKLAMPDKTLDERAEAGEGGPPAQVPWARKGWTT